MSKIVLFVGDLGPNKVDAVAKIRQTAGLSLSEILKAVRSKTPVIEEPLFSRDDPHFVSRLQSLLSSLETWGIAYDAYELLDKQNIEQVDRNKIFHVTSKILQTMIDTHQAELEYQTNLGALQDGADS